MTKGARGPAPPDALVSMLEARTVALVGASPREGSFGHRLVTEVSKSTAPLDIHLVNPRYDEVLGRRCVASLDEVPAPVDLVLLGVPDAALETELGRAAARGDAGAVIFGSVHVPFPGDGLRARLAELARDAGMALCGGGCMGFVNVVHGLRAVGYVEPDPLPAGPVALVSHSGSAFSALLRTNRRIGFTLAVSSGQELVTTAADYLHYALDLPGTGLVALLLETLRAPDALRAALARAAEQDVAVVALTVGGSPTGRRMVSAHSGALAGDDGVWEALFDAFGVVRVSDLDEMLDTLELFSAGRRATPRPSGGGIATVHDSGAERALVADVAGDVGVAFAEISEPTRTRLAGLLDPGLEATNPLDLWGTGDNAREVFAGALTTLAGDDAVAAVALCVDLVTEYDGDESYLEAVLDAYSAVSKPMAVMSNVRSAIDQSVAGRLRAAGVPVLEGTRTGLLALRHLLDHGDGARLPAPRRTSPDRLRQARWMRRLGTGPLGGAEALALLGDYGIATARVQSVASRSEALEAGASIGYRIVLKTDEAGIDHKSDVGGVVLGIEDAEGLARSYDTLAERLGPRALVCESVPPGVELALGVVRAPGLGALVVVGAGGVLAELIGDRAVGLAPLDAVRARAMLDRLALRPLLDGVRGAPPCDLDAAVRAVVAVSELAAELGDGLEALDVNPVVCGPGGAVAVDALIVGCTDAVPSPS